MKRIPDPSLAKWIAETYLPRARRGGEAPATHRAPPHFASITDTSPSR
jgi:hypothetical protein